MSACFDRCLSLQLLLIFILESVWHVFLCLHTGDSRVVCSNRNNSSGRPRAETKMKKEWASKKCSFYWGPQLVTGQLEVGVLTCELLSVDLPKKYQFVTVGHVFCLRLVSCFWNALGSSRLPSFLECCISTWREVRGGGEKESRREEKHPQQVLCPCLACNSHNSRIHTPIIPISNFTQMSNRIKWWRNDIFYPKCQWSTSLLHHNVPEKHFFGHYLLIWIQRCLHLHFLSLDDNQDRGPPGPLVVHHKLIGFADIELQVIVVTPGDEALYQSSVLLCKNSL